LTTLRGSVKGTKGDSNAEEAAVGAEVSCATAGGEEWKKKESGGRSEENDERWVGGERENRRGSTSHFSLWRGEKDWQGQRDFGSHMRERDLRMKGGSGPRGSCRRQGTFRFKGEFFITLDA